MPEFLAKFATLLVQESKGKLALDGRRLGFLYRNLLAMRAIELAKAETLRAPSYRSAGAEVDVHASGCELEVHEAEGVLQIRLDHDGRAYRTSLRWTCRGAPGPPAGLWARLTGSERRRQRSEDDAWSAQLAAASSGDDLDLDVRVDLAEASDEGRDLAHEHVRHRQPHLPA